MRPNSPFSSTMWHLNGFSNIYFTFHTYFACANFSSKVLTDDECRTLIKETESIGYEPARSFKFRLVHTLFGYEPARLSIGSLIHKAKKRFFCYDFRDGRVFMGEK